jgi:ABC-2 type transport system ATP-binding protein
MKQVLPVSYLCKQYKGLLALNDFCIRIVEGQSFGLLGPMRSGTTTFLGMLLGVTQPNRGRFSCFENGELEEGTYKHELESQLR